MNPSSLFFFLDFCPSMAYNNHMKGVDYVLRAVNDRLKSATRIIEGVVECQESV